MEPIPYEEPEDEEETPEKEQIKQATLAFDEVEEISGEEAEQEEIESEESKDEDSE